MPAEIATNLVMVPAATGSYALVLGLAEGHRLWLRGPGPLRLERGYYVYVGSAFGPGGLRARLGRHWSGGGRRHWHVDYLRAVTRPVDAWFQAQRQPAEHAWAAALGRGRGLRPVPGFGCSDCHCPTHLYWSARPPSFAAFRRRLGRVAGGDGPLQRIPDRAPVDRDHPAVQG